MAKIGLGPEGLLLQNRSGRIWRYKDAAAMFRVLTRPLGLSAGEGLHLLRHTCVSMLIQQNCNAKTIQGHVGPESIEETMDTYGHLFPSTLKDLASNLDAFGRAFDLEDRNNEQTA